MTHRCPTLETTRNNCLDFPDHSCGSGAKRPFDYESRIFKDALIESAKIQRLTGASRTRRRESAVFFADFNDAVMSRFTRESEALIEADLIKAPFALRGTPLLITRRALPVHREHANARR